MHPLGSGSSACLYENGPIRGSFSSPWVTISHGRFPINTAGAENANVTGAWSLDLSGEIARHFDLSLTQNKDAIMGYGAISGGNGTQQVTASGSLSIGKIMLTVMPIDSLDLYKLDLSLDSQTSGTYTAYSASGDTWSGDVTGTAPSGISSTASALLVHVLP